MSASLYNIEILRLAASLTDAARLVDPDGTAEVRSPTCGSRVTTDVAVRDGRVIGFAQQVRACALGQASAALLAAHVEGSPVQSVRDTAANLRAFLTGKRDDPGSWPGLDIFNPASAYPARHAAILLPFDAAVAAIRQAAMQKA